MLVVHEITALVCVICVTRTLDVTIGAVLTVHE
jgi:hypothetical protein